MSLDSHEAKLNFADSFNVSRETLSKFEDYYKLLLLWSKRINLIGKTTIDDFWNRHIIDSAQILNYAKDSDINWIDLGSGAGFPGLVIAKLLSAKSPNFKVTLVDSSVKRCSFLREAARALEVNVNIENKKVEEVTPGKFNVITARAFTSLDNLLSYSSSFAQLNTRMLFLKGLDADKEIIEAQKNYNFDYKLYPSISDKRGCVIEVTNLSNKHSA